MEAPRQLPRSLAGRLVVVAAISLLIGYLAPAVLGSIIRSNHFPPQLAEGPTRLLDCQQAITILEGDLYARSQHLLYDSSNNIKRRASPSQALPNITARLQQLQQNCGAQHGSLQSWLTKIHARLQQLQRVHTLLPQAIPQALTKF